MVLTRNKKRKQYDEFETSYFSPNSLKNYILEDPILDYLKKKYKNPIKTVSAIDYILEEGNHFEKAIIAELYSKFPLKICTISNEYRENKLEHYEYTKEIILDSKYEIILNGLLINDYNCTYGYPDLIVKGKWIIENIKNNKIELDPSIYYIIDIKSSCIHLIDNGTYVANNKLYKFYKSQVYIYMKALEQIQNITSQHSFILGKSYSQTVNNINHKEYNPFHTLGVIDYKKESINFDSLISKAIEWKHKLDNEWHLWDETKPVIKEMYPNMKNQYDYPYTQRKKEIAQKIKEITLLWKCGTSQREKAFDQKIKNYSNKRLKSSILGVQGPSENILNNIIEINQSSNLISIPEKNNINNWRKQTHNELYVDFETYNENNKTILYMIGIGIYTNKWEYTLFYIGDSICNNEKDVIEQFYNYIKPLRSKRLIHWSKAEPVIMNKKLKEYNLHYNFHWYDLLEVFRNTKHPIVIKDCFKYGLKEIVNTLYKHKLVSIQWTDLNDALLSVFIAKDIYNKRVPFDEYIKQIIEYNEIDCKALYELLNLIRFHSN